MSERLLIIFPTDGHGGCEYNSLTFGKFAAEKLGLDVFVSFPLTDNTRLLHSLVERNGMKFVDFVHPFDRNDDQGRYETSRRRCSEVLDSVMPSFVFIALPWPKRGLGLISACADVCVPTLVKFALVPTEALGTPPQIVADLREAQQSRQHWFANSRFSAALIEKHWQLPPFSVDSFHVGPIGLASLAGEAETRPVREVGTARAWVRSEFGLPENSLVVTTVARLSVQKGYTSYLEAAAAVARAHSDVHFVWVGEGELRAQLEAQITALHMENRIHLAGFRPDVRAILRGSDIFVLPTIYEGGCSQALLEAMEEKLPIVVSNTSAIGDVVRDGEHVLYAAPGDAASFERELLRVVSDQALRTRLGEAAGGRAPRFAKEVMFAETVLRLDHLLGSQYRFAEAFADVWDRGGPGEEVGAALPMAQPPEDGRIRFGGASVTGGGVDRTGAQQLDVVLGFLKGNGFDWRRVRFKLRLSRNQLSMEFRQRPDWPTMFEIWPGDEADSYGPILKIIPGRLGAIMRRMKTEKDREFVRTVCEAVPDIVARSALPPIDIDGAGTTWTAHASRFAESILSQLQARAITAETRRDDRSAPAGHLA
jgi:glycosyltransferase involved in cell wall biosynthesis